ncbi:hypothetical protein [Cystobacter ferrugineus]|uniref:Uncharacterized protein n=1 Tax=Cystobacter ferrugineus TaxID=83449 RepID=A0A1L9B446_9BACT|nr:hypothetical protein [Cystobacter ferrugineus]OJH37014.1 hypothetical protein BON30_31515 [Cystobacter ferrugineus]
MAKYTVKLSKPPRGHEVPPLLADVGDWMGQQIHGTLGWFDALAAEAIPAAPLLDERFAAWIAK